MLPKGSLGWGIHAGSPQTPSPLRAPLSRRQPQRRSIGISQKGCTVRCVPNPTPLAPLFGSGDGRHHLGATTVRTLPPTPSPTPVSPQAPCLTPSQTVWGAGPWTEAETRGDGEAGGPCAAPGCPGMGRPRGSPPMCRRGRGWGHWGGWGNIPVLVWPCHLGVTLWGQGETPRGSWTPQLLPNTPPSLRGLTGTLQWGGVHLLHPCHRDIGGTLGCPPSSIPLQRMQVASPGPQRATEGTVTPVNMFRRTPFSPLPPHSCCPRSPCTVAIWGGGGVSHCLRTQHPLSRGPLLSRTPRRCKNSK